MTDKTLFALQKEVDRWIHTVGGGYWSPHENLARLAEEVGELARLINHLHGPKPKKPTESPQEMREELGDILFVLICMANALDIDLAQTLEQVLGKVWSRDRYRFVGSPPSTDESHP